METTGEAEGGMDSSWIIRVESKGHAKIVGSQQPWAVGEKRKGEGKKERKKER